MTSNLLQQRETDINFQQQLKRNNENYHRLLENPIDTPKQFQDIMKKIKGKDKKQIYMYFGYLLGKRQKQLHQVARYLYQHFHPNTKKPYKFVFFNDKTYSNYVLFNFKKIFSYLQLEYLAALQQFIVVKPYFYHKTTSWMVFGVIPKFINSRTKSIYNYKDLYQYLNISQYDLANNVPSFLLKQQLPELYSSTSPSDFRINIEGQERSQQYKKQMFQFPKEIKSMIMKPGYEINYLHDYETSQQGVPTILKLLIQYFNSKEEKLKFEGLFRKSVDIVQQNKTISQILSYNYDYLLLIQNPHIIANLIKRFFSSLKIPIIPFDKYKTLLNQPSITIQSSSIKSLIKQLPDLNKITLTFIFTFFRQKVLKYQIYNKMSIQNLAICFAPCIFRSEKPSIADIINANKPILYCKIMINQFDEVFGTKQQQEILYRKTYLQNQINFQNQLYQKLSTNSKSCKQNKLEIISTEYLSKNSQIKSTQSSFNKILKNTQQQSDLQQNKQYVPMLLGARFSTKAYKQNKQLQQFSQHYAHQQPQE